MDVGSMLCVLHLKFNRRCLPSSRNHHTLTERWRKTVPQLKRSFKHKVIEMIGQLGLVLQLLWWSLRTADLTNLCLLLPRHCHNSRSYEFRYAMEAQAGDTDTSDIKHLALALAFPYWCICMKVFLDLEHASLGNGIMEGRICRSGCIVVWHDFRCISPARPAAACMAGLCI